MLSKGQRRRGPEGQRARGEQGDVARGGWEDVEMCRGKEVSQEIRQGPRFYSRFLAGQRHRSILPESNCWSAMQTQKLFLSKG